MILDAVFRNNQMSVLKPWDFSLQKSRSVTLAAGR